MVKKVNKKGPETIITNDYDMFEPFEFNRDVRKTEQLKESMLKFGFDEGSALNCRRKANGKLQIIQGHHRFEVAKGLGMPVAVIISKSDIPVWALERGTHPWNVVDFVTGFAREGRSEYQELLEFKNKSGMPTSQCISMLRGGASYGTHYTDHAKQGDFSINHRAYANRVASIVAFMKEEGLDVAKHTLFLNALKACMLLPEWSDDRWMQKVKTHKALLDRQPTTGRYLENIELVYNRQCKESERYPIAFEARKQSRIRGYQRSKKQ